MRPQHILSYSTSCTAIFLNCFMMFVILRHSTEKIGKYKYLLFLYTLDGALFSSVQISVMPNWVTLKNSYIFTPTVTFLPRILQTIALTVWVALFDIMLSIVCWSFWYRITCIADKMSDFFENKRRLFLIMLFNFVVLCFLSLNIVSIHNNEKTDKYFKEIIASINNQTVDEVGYIGGPFFNRDPLISICHLSHASWDELNWILFAALAGHGSFNCSVITFICFCWFKIRREIQALQSLSQQKFQYRIYLLLTIQACLPIVFDSTPVILAFTLSLLQLDIGDWIQVAGVLISTAQVIEPLCILFLVNDYKRALYKMLNVSTKGSLVSDYSHSRDQQEN